MRIDLKSIVQVRRGNLGLKRTPRVSRPRGTPSRKFVRDEAEEQPDLERPLAWQGTAASSFVVPSHVKMSRVLVTTSSPCTVSWRTVTHIAGNPSQPTVPPKYVFSARSFPCRLLSRGDSQDNAVMPRPVWLSHMSGAERRHLQTVNPLNPTIFIS